MGTRGACGFVVDGKIKVSYNHYDSYPSGLGAEIVQFLNTNKIDTLKKYAKSIKLVDSEKTPTATQLKKLQSIGFNVNEGDNWYNILRSYQGKLQQALSNNCTFMTDEQDFLKDSLFCEYAYLINLDEGILEFYRGFNQSPILTGRFAGFPAERGYYPVVLMKSYPLEDLYAGDFSVIVNDMESLCRSGEDEE